MDADKTVSGFSDGLVGLTVDSLSLKLVCTVPKAGEALRVNRGK